MVEPLDLGRVEGLEGGPAVLRGQPVRVLVLLESVKADQTFWGHLSGRVLVLT